jgi:hypothetical protein
MKYESDMRDLSVKYNQMRMQVLDVEINEGIRKKVEGTKTSAQNKEPIPISVINN